MFYDICSFVSPHCLFHDSPLQADSSLLLMTHFTALMKHIFMLMSVVDYFSPVRFCNEKDLPSP